MILIIFTFLAGYISGWNMRGEESRVIEEENKILNDEIALLKKER